MTRSVGLETFETAYSPYFIHDGGKVSPHVIKLRKNEFSPVSNGISLEGVKRSVMTKEKADKAAIECYAALGHMMRLFASQNPSHLQALFGSSSL